jgi:predicted alpha/beta hydrolase
MQRRDWARPVLLAHSFAGQALGIVDELHDVAGAILVGSQMGHRHHWRGLSRLRLELFWRLLMPIAAELFGPRGGVVPSWLLGEPLPLGVAREWRRWAMSADWFLSHYAGVAGRFARFDRPLLAYAISDDDVAPVRAVDDLLRRFRSTAVTRVDVTPRELGRRRIGHMGLFRPEGTGPIWNAWLRFILAHGAAEPISAAA